MTLNENLVAVTERIADAVRENRCNITDLQGQLSTEVQARIDGDADLALELSDERAVRAAGDAELNGKLSTEQQARIDGDARLDTAISTEKNARISADASLGQRIDLLRDGLDTEQQARIDGDTGLSDRITAEVAARVSGDNDLGSRITLETTARENADTGLQSQITAEAQTRQAEDTALGGRIDAEATARASADTLLGDRITALSQQSSGEIDALSDRIDAEVQARIDGDDALDGRISAEASARSTADQNLQSQIDSIAAASDVVDVVGTKAALDAYDTSKLTDADIIKVLTDETQSGATSYYRWSATTHAFSLIGTQGPYHTKAEADALFVHKDADSVGSATTPTYITGGKVTASTASVGSASVPVYMDNGAVTQCGSDLSVNITGQAAKAVSDGQGRNIVNTYATSADLTSRISSEESARTAADSSIRTDMGSLSDLDTTDKTSLVHAINEVNQSSGGAVATLTQRIAAEETARANADTALGNRIDSEESARSSADTALSTRINNENTERQAVTGTLTDLMTDDQTNLVAAINEVDTNADVAYAIADAALPKTGGTITGNLTVSGSITGSLAGNAATATKLATARTINVQDADATNTGTAASFDGSGNATIKLPATIKASLTGNADSATKLATARTINGVAFNGTADITVADDTKLPLSGGTITGDLEVNGDIKDKQNYEVVGVANNADAHNAIFRGKDLTNVYTIDQLSNKIQADDWSDLYIGDYITKAITVDGNTTTQKWRFAGFDWYMNTGYAPDRLTAHHIVMVPDGSLLHKGMNATNVITGGYKGSRMWTETMPQVRTGLNNAFGSDHVLKRPIKISSAVNTSTPSMAGAGWTGASTQSNWVDCWVTLLTEVEVMGAAVVSSSNYDIGAGGAQLPLFQHSRRLITVNGAWWLSGVGMSADFVRVHSDGTIGSWYTGAAAELGVRPVWLFY